MSVDLATVKKWRVAWRARAHRASGASLSLDFCETATEAIGALVPGRRVVGISRGQFSSRDLLDATLQQIGPAEVTICTWTAGAADIEALGEWADAGRILSLTYLTDRSFPSRHPEYAKALVRVFDSFPEDFAARIHVAHLHAKWWAAKNESWAVACRGSLNFNRNPRFENYDLDVDDVIANGLLEFAEEVCAKFPGLKHNRAGVSAAFKLEEFGGEWREAGPGGGSPTRRPVTVRLSDAQKQRVADVAQARGVSVGAFLRALVEWAIDEE